MDPEPSTFAQDTLLNAFRTHYHRFQASVTNIVNNPTDATVIAQLRDEFDECVTIVQEVSRTQCRRDLWTWSPSHSDPEFLRWAYGQRSTASIGHYLGVSQSVVRNALLEHGIVEQQTNPFPQNTVVDAPDVAAKVEDGIDDILDPDLPVPHQFPPDVKNLAQTTTLFTGPVFGISDDNLDTLLICLRTHYRRAGLSMLNGMLRRLGHCVPTERVHQSLLRIDPVCRIFERIRIRRRDYRVLGPNSLWHHDRQHGLSVYNVHIERLWVDVTAQVGAAWADRFILLELRYGLDINSIAHIWLLHFLFLATINSKLAFFAESWNQHQIQIRNGPNHSPTDMFVFDMFVNGVRGDRLPEQEEGLGDNELGIYGIDWQGLCDEAVLQNNSMAKGSTSWVGCVGPPPDLSEVVVQPPTGTLSEHELLGLNNAFSNLLGSANEDDIISLWTNALAYVRVLYPDAF
ncbi:hypothetical protein C8R43DRAFT_904859 [Mycena crocata]|nr:hypothetical protein C8R43DRAFT_904859 [Mycena crocata]